MRVPTVMSGTVLKRKDTAVASTRNPALVGLHPMRGKHTVDKVQPFLGV